MCYYIFIYFDFVVQAVNFWCDCKLVAYNIDYTEVPLYGFNISQTTIIRVIA